MNIAVRSVDGRFFGFGFIHACDDLLLDLERCTVVGGGLSGYDDHFLVLDSRRDAEDPPVLISRALEPRDLPPGERWTEFDWVVLCPSLSEFLRRFIASAT